MSLLEYLVDRSFRNEKAGRVVVFSGDRKNRGYVVKSEAEELKIKSFLKMFYFAHLSILILGCLLVPSWSQFLIYSLDSRPATHLLRGMCIAGVIYFLVVGVPYLLLWRAYKAAFLNFVSPQDEVLVLGKSPSQKRWILIAVALIFLGALVLFTSTSFVPTK